MDVNGIAPIETMPVTSTLAATVARRNADAEPAVAVRQPREVKTPVVDPGSQAPQSVEISVNKATGCFVFKVIDQQTGKVVSEVPRERVLDAMAQMLKGSGKAFDQSA